MPSLMYSALVGVLVLVVVGAVVTLFLVLVQSGKTDSVGEPLGGRESPLYLAADPTGYGRGSGDEVIEASGPRSILGSIPRSSASTTDKPPSGRACHPVGVSLDLTQPVPDIHC